MKRFLLLRQDLDVITIPTTKWNNKVNQAEKGVPADFSIGANVTRVNALAYIGHKSSQTVGKANC